MMKYILTNLLWVFFSTVAHAQLNQDTSNPNLDFSMGDFTHWQRSWGGRNNPDSVTGSQPGTSSHVVVGISGNNWDGLVGVGGLKRVPDGLTQVARLGAPSGGGYGTPKAYKMQYAINVQPDYPILLLRLASVMDNSHDSIRNTHYRLSILDTGGSYLPAQPCGGIEVFPKGTSATSTVNTASIPPTALHWLPVSGSVQYQPWSSIAVDLSGYAGQTVILRLEHFDCWTGFHGSYDYFSAGMVKNYDTVYFCPNSQNLVIRPHLPDFSSYNWTGGIMSDTLVVNKPQSGDTYSCTANSYNGCATDFHFTLKEYQISPAFLDTPGSSCNEIRFADYSAPIDGIISWQWDFGDTASNDNSSSLQNPIHVFTHPGSYIVGLVVKTSDSCEARLQKTVEVSANAPVANMVVADAACENVPVLLLDSSLHFSKLQWFLDNSPAGTATRFFYSFAEPGAHKIMLVATANGCSDTIRKILTVHPAPVASITAQPHIAPVTNPVINFHGSPDGMMNYVWTLGFASAVSTVQSPSVVYPSTIDSYRVELIVVDINGCIDTAEQQIAVVSPNIIFPNAFTPNGDGKNDIFKPMNITDQHLLEFRIFNRYGECIFYSSSATDGWDGTIKGIIAPVGTYYYMAYFMLSNGSPLMLKGDITVVR